MTRIKQKVNMQIMQRIIAARVKMKDTLYKISTLVKTSLVGTYVIRGFKGLSSKGLSE